MGQAGEIVKKYCEHCGAAGRAEARFCTSCGLEMVAVPQQVNQTLNPVDDSADQETGEIDGASSMGLGMAWLIYLGAMVLWLGVVLLPNGPVTGILALTVHFGFGFVMTRYVMRGLIEFHPMHNTLANVFAAKLLMFLLWPLRMPVLLFKLTVSSSL